MSNRRRKRRGPWDGIRIEAMRQSGYRALKEGTRIAHNCHPEKNPFKQLSILKQAFLEIEAFVTGQSELNRQLNEQLLGVDDYPNNGMRWEQNEDEALVQWRSDGAPITKIARELGRSPGACMTRLSTLIGVPRGELVEAVINGRLNESPVSGLFVGRVRTIPRDKSPQDHDHDYLEAV